MTKFLKTAEPLRSQPDSFSDSNAVQRLFAMACAFVWFIASAMLSTNGFSAAMLLEPISQPMNQPMTVSAWVCTSLFVATAMLIWRRRAVLGFVVSMTAFVPVLLIRPLF